MKKLIKNKICGSVNNTRMYWSRKNWSNVAATVHVPYMNSSHKWEKTREKKKKKKKRKNAAKLNAGNANPNTHLVQFEAYQLDHAYREGNHSIDLLG